MYSPDKLLYTGKTKDVYTVRNHPDLFILYFKDNILGRKGIPDSGGNEVVGQLPGKGKAVLALTSLFFGLLGRAGIKTHFIKELSSGRILIRRTDRIPIEFICRNYACGSYMRRNPCAQKFKKLGGLIEYTLKSDAADDPLLPEKKALDFMTVEEKSRIDRIIAKINRVSAEFLKRAGVKLVDFKSEFGRRSGELILVDDFSTDTARFADGRNHILSPKNLCLILTRRQA